MGRRRKHDHHLPRYVRLKNGGYQYRNPTTGKETLLSKSLEEARARLGHASAAITQSVYRVGEEEVLPLR